MTVLEWSDALSLDLPLMDDTHREFVDLLAAAAQADDRDLLAAWAALVEHTQAHFDREDQWMADTRFSSGNCHSTQHKVVLAVMREGGRRGAEGDLALVRQMASELAVWFPQHAQSMDAALALHVRRVGYDPLTGRVTMPDALPADMIQGCGGSCEPSPIPAATLAGA
jgi:hemerythrin-like metal-binding protein